jgi:hypothetical protein
MRRCNKRDLRNPKAGIIGYLEEAACERAAEESFPPLLFACAAYAAGVPSIAGAFLIPGAAWGAQQCGEECYRCGVFDPLGQSVPQS